ncbi:serine/threonine protein kinase [Actinokineospora sp. PR83]|uniref:serine/threonine-protein kinase n=1 Tax=Actinokineospora sp. PR83 TaxID=2884908 RepID=UPI001F43271A|nr:serine/threonine-protein kinase [Actinokineospora sp. PR83]MCG8918774.1 serine/threonine protein kinase [Actinokineospora sp. PR83]
MVRFTDNNGVEWNFDEADRIGDPSGMGAVFSGTAADGAAVAVKRVRLPNPTEERRRQRDREVAIFQRLVQANRSGEKVDHLVLPLGHCYRGDDLLIVMPRADESLSASLTRGRFDIAGGIDVVGQVARGLVQLAALSIVHRDLKPANVLRFGSTWRIIDFGLSRDLTEATGTYTLAGWGTLPYMAPELWLNQPANAKSDLYALGVLAFEIFAGTRPFAGPDDVDYRNQHLHEAPPDLPDTPPGIGRLVVRLLHKSPAARPQDARAVCEVLAAQAQRLRPVQHALVDAAHSLERRRMADHTATSVAEAETESRTALRDQAMADLGEILADAYDDLHEALPDAEGDQAARSFTIGGLTITFEVGQPLQLTLHHSSRSTVLQGVVRLTPVTGPSSVHAHLYCAPRADARLAWEYSGPSVASTDRMPLTAAAVLEILVAAMEKHVSGE